jgi:dihydroorotate dehydrogenase electron transfer subunit
MNTSLDQPGILEMVVAERRAPCREHFELLLRADRFPSAVPGQFVQVLCAVARDGDGGRDRTTSCADAARRAASGGETAAPILRRPLSIASLRRLPDHCELGLMGRVVGAGTAWLDARRPGDVISVLGPLGNGFSMPPRGAGALLVAGGVGLPPIRWLGEILRKNGISCDAIYGARTRELIPLSLIRTPSETAVPTLCAEEFARHDIPTAIMTDDGSCGLRGQVTDAMQRYFDSRETASRVHVFACGPEAMLRAVAAFCAGRELACEVAIERMMGCGMGTCQSCVVPVSDEACEDGWRYALSCTEGPVFDAARLRWPR